MPIASEKLSHYVSLPSLLLAFPSFFFHPSKLRGPPPLFRHASDRPSAPALPPPLCSKIDPAPSSSLPSAHKRRKGEKRTHSSSPRNKVESERRVEWRRNSEEMKNSKTSTGKKIFEFEGRWMVSSRSRAGMGGGGTQNPPIFSPPDRARSEISSP